MQQINSEAKMTTKKFTDRAEAGQALARILNFYANKRDAIVLALPRGGVPVGYEIAHKLNLPLDVWLVRKLGVPGQEELAMGAIGFGGVRYLNDELIDMIGITPEQIEDVAQKEDSELKRRTRLYRGDRPLPELKGKTVILVDDGLATGATMLAAIKSLSQTEAARIVVAVPVGARSTCLELEQLVDDVICIMTPDPFYGVGRWYSNFDQTSDQDVQMFLKAAHQPAAHERKTAL
ncbi:MAG: phosphoribosyltransferase [Pseudomonadota bacterium]